MKMNLDMTFEDGLKVIEALRECAIKNGWEKDELDDCGIMEEYSAVVDAALTAMGITVNIDKEPKVEDEDEHCDAAADCYFCNSEDEEEEVDAFGVPTNYWSTFDENTDKNDNKEDDCEYALTPKGEFIAQLLEDGVPFESACALANFLFDDDEGE